MDRNVKDVVAAAAPEIPVNEQVQALVAAACDELTKRAAQLFDDVMAEMGDAPAGPHLALSCACQAAASLSVLAIGKSIEVFGYPFMDAWRIVNVDIQTRADNIIRQSVAIVSPGSDKVN